MDGYGTTCTKFTAIILLLIPVSHGLNLGLIAGDLKRHSSPLIIKKISKHSPIFINVHSGLSKSKAPLSLSKLPPKPPPLKLLGQKPSKKVPRSLPPLSLPPILPPLLPIILPPILPPLIPLLPLPLLPILPPLLPMLKPPLKPLRIPILKKEKRSPLKPIGSTLKPLGSTLKPIKVSPTKLDKKGILSKLLDLKKEGSLTTAEYIRIKKLLLH